MKPRPIQPSRSSPSKSPRAASTTHSSADTLRAGLDRPSRPKALFVTVSKYPNSDKYQTLTTVRRDMETLRTYLVREKRFLPEDIRILRCDENDPKLRPTKENINREIDALVKNTRPGDFRLFYHAGHVDQLPTNSESEEDGLDEAIVTVDAVDSSHPTNNLIRDNDLRIRLVNGMNEGSSLIAILEGCHSATLLDLNTTRRFPKLCRVSSGDSTHQPFCSQRSAVVRRGRKSARQSSGQAGAETRSITPMPRSASPEDYGEYRATSDYARVVCISACLDHQESFTNEKTMIHTLVELLSSHENLTPRLLQERLGAKLAEEKMRVARIVQERNNQNGIMSEEQIRDWAWQKQSPKVSTLRGYTKLLDLEFSIPTAPS